MLVGYILSRVCLKIVNTFGYFFIFAILIIIIGSGISPVVAISLRGCVSAAVVPS